MRRRVHLGAAFEDRAGRYPAVDPPGPWRLLRRPVTHSNEPDQASDWVLLWVAQPPRRLWLRVLAIFLGALLASWAVS